VVSLVPGQVGGCVLVIDDAKLVNGAAVIGLAFRGPSCVCSFHWACSINGHVFEELGSLEAVVGGDPA
jgi:hypothetical protein